MVWSAQADCDVTQHHIKQELLKSVSYTILIWSAILYFTIQRSCHCGHRLRRWLCHWVPHCCTEVPPTVNLLQCELAPPISILSWRHKWFEGSRLGSRFHIMSGKQCARLHHPKSRIECCLFTDMLKAGWFYSLYMYTILVQETSKLWLRPPKAFLETLWFEPVLCCVESH